MVCWDLDNLSLVWFEYLKQVFVVSEVADESGRHELEVVPEYPVVARPVINSRILVILVNRFVPFQVNLPRAVVPCDDKNRVVRLLL